MDQHFDVIIAGGGMSGALTRARIQRAQPDKRILVLEKEPTLGGRLQRYCKESPWSYGLGFISQELFDFWDQELKQDPEGADLSSFHISDQQTAGFLVGSKIQDVALSDLYHQAGAKALGGMSASKQWHEVEKVLATDADSKQFSELCAFPRKGPLAIVLETLSGSLGVPDVWSANTRALNTRMKLAQGKIRKGAWAKPLETLIGNPEQTLTHCRIVQADFENDLWTIKTERGTYTADRLVVAQPPWQASLWLPKKEWPIALLNLVNKTKPVSVVVLSFHMENAAALTAPDLTIVPSENVHIVREYNDMLVFQATIDFEMSLQAPDVLKAVKALKRAAKKLQAANPELKLTHEHIALLPVAWSHSPAASERKYFDKIDLDDIQKPHLVFVGDAYGNSYDGDHNIVESVRKGSEVISEWPTN